MSTLSCKRLELTKDNVGIDGLADIGSNYGGINPYTLTAGPRPARIRGSGPLEDDAWPGQPVWNPAQGIKADLEIKQDPGQFE